MPKPDDFPAPVLGLPATFQKQAVQTAEAADSISDAVALPQAETTHSPADEIRAAELVHWQAKSAGPQPIAEAALVMQGTFVSLLLFKISLGRAPGCSYSAGGNGHASGAAGRLLGG